MTVERRFRVHLRRQLNAEDEAALRQAGIEVERPASDRSATEALIVEAADEAEAGLRIRAALGGDEDHDIRPAGG